MVGGLLELICTLIVGIVIMTVCICQTQQRVNCTVNFKKQKRIIHTKKPQNSLLLHPNVYIIITSECSLESPSASVSAYFSRNISQPSPLLSLYTSCIGLCLISSMYCSDPRDFKSSQNSLVPSTF